MRVMLASEAGSPDVRNDDWAGATSTGIAVVLDGLSESGPTGCRHGTGWYVHQLGSHLLNRAADPAVTLADAVVVLDQPAEPVALTDVSVRGHIPEAVDLAALITAQQLVRNQPDGY